MYSKEEAARIRKDFWIEFDTFTKNNINPDKKWLTYNTGLKDLVLKFDINKERARVILAIENKNEDIRFDIFVKFKDFEMLYEEYLDNTWTWDEQYELDNGKQVCAIYKELENVNIYNRNTWEQIFTFFYTEMQNLESAFEETKLLLEDYIKTNYK